MNTNIKAANEKIKQLEKEVHCLRCQLRSYITTTTTTAAPTTTTTTAA